MDNAKIHRSEEVTNCIKTLRLKVLYLSAYSPVCAPVESFFGILKANFKALVECNSCNLTNESGDRVIFDSHFSIPPAKVVSCCGAMVERWRSGKTYSAGPSVN